MRYALRHKGQKIGTVWLDRDASEISHGRLNPLPAFRRVWRLEERVEGALESLSEFRAATSDELDAESRVLAEWSALATGLELTDDAGMMVSGVRKVTLRLGNPPMVRVEWDAQPSAKARGAPERDTGAADREFFAQQSTAATDWSRVQQARCRAHRAPYLAAPPRAKVGIADLAESGRWPLHGMRHPPEGDTSGWYLWAGNDPMSTEPDFFVPLHITHLHQRCREVLPYLGLGPGWRFLLAPDHVDVWYDGSLLVDSDDPEM